MMISFTDQQAGDRLYSLEIKLIVENARLCQNQNLRAGLLCWPYSSWRCSGDITGCK